MDFIYLLPTNCEITFLFFSKRREENNLKKRYAQQSDSIIPYYAQVLDGGVFSPKHRLSATDYEFIWMQHKKRICFCYPQTP